MRNGNFKAGNFCRLILTYSLARTVDEALLWKDTRPGPDQQSKLEMVKGQVPSLILEVLLYGSGVIKAYKVLVNDEMVFVRPEEVVCFVPEE